MEQVIANRTAYDEESNKMISCAQNILDKVRRCTHHANHLKSVMVDLKDQVRRDPLQMEKMQRGPSRRLLLMDHTVTNIINDGMRGAATRSGRNSS